MVNFDEITHCDWFTNDSPFRMNFKQNNPKLCVITGNNASGKSLLRKLIYNEYLDRKVELMHLSMAARCRSGMHRVFLYGSEEDQATGHNTAKGILDAIKTSKSRDKPHSLLFDEPEIGCSDELAAGIGFNLATALPTLDKLECCYVISHNRYLINQLSPLNPSHVHLMSNKHDYISLQDWLDRPVNPVYVLKTVIDQGVSGWRYVESQIKKNKNGV